MQLGELKLKIGIDARFHGYLIDDDAANSENREIRIDTRVPITVSVVEDGVTYGGFFRLRNTAGNTTALPQPGGSRPGMQFEYNYVYAQSDWGKVELGDNDGAQSVLYVSAPFVGLGQAMPANGNITGSPSAGYAFGPANWLAQSNRISYYSPKMSGFEVGVGFSPEYGSRGNDMSRLTTGLSLKDTIEGGVRWTGQFDATKLVLGAGFGSGQARNAARDLETWNVGAQAVFGGVTVGGAYWLDGKSLTPGDRSGWNAGATWVKGKLGFGASYGAATTELAAGGSNDDTLWGVGVDYKLTRYISLSGDVLFLESDTAANDANIFAIRTRFVY